MRRRSGMTLLELLLVLALVVMVLAVSYPAMSGLLADARLKAGADHLRAKFAEARTQAIEQNRPFRFAVKPGESGYKLAPETAEHWGGMGDVAADAPTEEQAGGTFVIEDVMPHSIRFNVEGGADAGSSDGYIGILTFLPDGSCSDDNTIRLELDDANPIEIRVRALTGSVTVRSVRAGDE